ncbi:MAG TPA: carbohydrate ABC transporter permease [Eubacteriales bacterium]|nr:carbohydrate ABC transporter permease [Eubacteriales bacterium]
MKTIILNFFGRVKAKFKGYRSLPDRIKRSGHRLKEKTTGVLNYSDYKRPIFKLVYTLILLTLFIAVLTVLLPPLWLFVSSFKDAAELESVPYSFWPDSFDLKKLGEVWRMLDFGKYYSNTFIVAVGAVASSVVFNGLLAYAFAVIKPKGWRFFYALVLAGYMIPAITSIVPLYKSIVDLGFINSFLPLWFVFGANAFYLIMFKSYFELLPKALFEAARIDGASDAEIFFKIVLPLSKPVVGVVSIFTMTAAWSDFLLPYLILMDDKMMTVMVKIYNIQATMGTITGFGPDKLLMVLTISILPQILLFIFFQRRITGSVATAGLKD